MYCIPLAHILYLQSDLKHVVIHTSANEEIRFFSKLSQMEDQLDRRFVRIHKSYIVNSEYVEFLDKKSHLLRLSNKETLPVSDAQYEKAIEKLRSLKH